MLETHQHDYYNVENTALRKNDAIMCDMKDRDPSCPLHNRWLDVQSGFIRSLTGCCMQGFGSNGGLKV